MLENKSGSLGLCSIFGAAGGALSLSSAAAAPDDRIETVPAGPKGEHDKEL